MKKSSTRLLLLFIYLFSFETLAYENISNEKIFGNFSIKEIHRRDKRKKESEIVVQSFTTHSPTTDEYKKSLLVPWNPTYSNTIMRISNKDLPVSDNDCSAIDAPLCNTYKDTFKETYWNGYCNTSCLAGGPELIAFDQKDKILYFAIPTTFTGTAGQMYFIFSSNLEDKKIKLIKNQFNLDEVNLSPSGRYLLFSGNSTISIYDTNTGNQVKIKQKNIWESGKQKLYFLGTIKWLSDTQFSYNESVRHSKFQSSFDEMKENTYDIAKQKILDSRLMPKSAYDSTPYTDAI